MALTANFIADFSSFTDATKDAVIAMRGFKDSAEELGPAADRSLEERQKQAEQLGRSVREVGTDLIAASHGFIEAYTEEQDAVQRLTSAIDQSTEAGRAIVPAYQELATQFQQTTKYADEAIISVEATLTTIGQVGPQQMELALHAVTNLASALGIDLDTAANLVAKSLAAMAQDKGPVAKLKAVLGDAYFEGMNAKEMLQAINDQVGPAAQNELNTYNGQIEHMKNQMSDFNESIGKILVDNLSGALKAFQALPEGVQKFIITVGVLGTALAPVLVSLGSLISILSATGLGAGIVAAATAIIAVLTGPVGLAVAAVAVVTAIAYNWGRITELTAALYQGIKTWLVDKFMALVGLIKGVSDSVVGIFRSMAQAIVLGSIVPDMVSGIGEQFSQLDALMVDPVRAATRDATRAFAGLTGPSPVGLNVGGLAGGGTGAGTVINISMTGMLGANDPQTRQAITQVVGDALAASMRGQRLLSSA